LGWVVTLERALGSKAPFDIKEKGRVGFRQARRTIMRGVYKGSSEKNDHARQIFLVCNDGRKKISKQGGKRKEELAPKKKKPDSNFLGSTENALKKRHDNVKKAERKSIAAGKANLEGWKREKKKEGLGSTKKKQRDINAL